MIARLLRMPGGLVLFVSMNVANVSNYLYQVVMGRALGPSAYGLLGSIIALVNVITVSFVSLQTASAKSIAASPDTPQPLGKIWDDPLTRRAVQLGAVLTGLLLVAAPFLATFLRGGIGPATIIGAAVIPSALLAIGQGRLQGLSAFYALAGVVVTAAALRLLLGPIAVALGGGVAGAGMAAVAAAAVAGLWALHLTRKAGPVAVRGARVDVGRAAVAFVVFWLMVSADIAVARHFLAANLAGQYAVASVLGKAVLWLPVAVAVAVFPRVARDRSSGLSTVRILIPALGFTVALAAIAVAGLYIAGGPVIPLFFGPKYTLASTFAWKIGLACAPFALAQLLIYYHLAHEGLRPFIPIVLGVAVEGAAMTVFHSSPNEIAVSLASGGVVMCLGLLVLAVARPISSTAEESAAQPLDVAPAVSQRVHR